LSSDGKYKLNFKAEKWRAKTIELSKAAGDEYQNFV